VNPLSARLEIVERDLAKATAEVALLRSDVATLVRVVDDIRTRKRQPLTSVAAPAKSGGTRTAASAVAGTVVGIAVGAWLWTYAGASAEQIVPTSAVAQASTEAVPPPATLDAKPAVETPKDTASQAPSKADPPLAANIDHPVGVNYVGTLSIDGQPGGEVFLDRRSVGRTPLRLEKLKAGSHLIWIERDGYQRWTRVVQVPSDRVTRLWADLEPLTSR
jgi:hypothetical protein